MARLQAQSLQQRVASKVQCAEGAACPFVWHCTYFLTSLGRAAGTLLITSTGKHDHAKPEVGSGRPAKLWTQRQLGDACHYMALTEKGQRSARQLQEHMVAKKHAAGSLPTLEQMSTWMQNHSRKRRDPSSKQVTAAGQEVAPTQIALEDWPRCGNTLEDLYLLGPQVVSAAEVFAPFTCRGMFGLRCTDVGAGAGRVQGRAFTTRAVPFLQATTRQETTANYVRLLPPFPATSEGMCPAAAQGFCTEQ